MKFDESVTVLQFRESVHTNRYKIHQSGFYHVSLIFRLESNIYDVVERLCVIYEKTFSTIFVIIVSTLVASEIYEDLKIEI